MKSDITRSTFKREKHYSGVRMQQGRVQLDADWNEQVDIANHRIDTESVDLIGANAAPKDNAGFELQIVGGDLRILAARDKSGAVIPGRFYVNGVLCEIEQDYSYIAQPDFPGANLPTDSGFYIAYLDVRQRHLTEIEDPSLHEIALGNVDTTTRSKTVWQVKLLKLSAPTLPGNPCGQTFKEWDDLVVPRRARLAARVEPFSAPSSDLCAVSPAAGFRRLTNQLYRVEIHTPGSVEIAKFKWSRDNGSIASAIYEISSVTDPDTNTTGHTIVLSEPGRDELRSFAPGQWVEIINETRELAEGRGLLVRLTSPTEGTTLTFDPDTSTEPVPVVSHDQALKEKWKVRRWDHFTETAEIPTAATGWIDLEDGVQVQFGEGDTYQTGDYWLIPARVITSNVEWPLNDNSDPALLDRFGIQHHYSRLAILELDTSGTWHRRSDCRNIFVPLSEQINFFYVSGDGQEALPGTMLARPLQVGVTNGTRRVAGARIKFEVIAGAGRLYVDKEGKNPLTLPIITGSDGIAQCYWQLDDNLENKSQQVQATLLDAADLPLHLPIRFNANQSRATLVSYFSLPDCKPDTPSVRSLFETDREPEPGLIIPKLPGWPDLDNDKQVTVSDILNGMLCHLDANRLPFQPDTCENDLYPDQDKMQSVGDALRALCKIMAKHVIYEDRECNNGQATVRTLLDEALGEAWPDFDGDGRVTVQDVLQALLCKLDAATLPFEPPVSCPNGIFADGIQSVGGALKALCNLQARHVAYQLLAQPTWQTAKDALDFLAQNVVTASGTISGTFGPAESETNPVVEFVGAEFDKFRIPQVIPTTPGAKLSWSHQMEVTADRRMRYHFRISKDQPGIFGYEIRFVKFQ